MGRSCVSRLRPTEERWVGGSGHRRDLSVPDRSEGRHPPTVTFIQTGRLATRGPRRTARVWDTGHGSNLITLTGRRAASVCGLSVDLTRVTGLATSGATRDRRSRPHTDPLGETMALDLSPPSYRHEPSMSPADVGAGDMALATRTPAVVSIWPP